MRIDSHMHVWSFEGVEYYDNKPLFTYMEELKLYRTALIAINNDENAKVKKLVEQYPNKFFGIAYVDRENQEASLCELECGVKAGYYKGIKVLSYQGGFHVDDPIQMRTYAKCLDEGVAFGCVFPGEEELAHQANEYITLDSMMKNVRIIAHAIEKLAGE